MCDLPENLQTIKRELSPSSTPEEKSPNSIKAKLNLHVKRRLLDFNQTTEDSPSTAAQCKQLDTPKTETVRQKRPYHKRADKNKTNNPTTATGETPAAAAACLVGIATTTTPQRKYKHKIKQITTTTSTLENHQEYNNTEEQTATGNHHNTALTTGAISAGDEDEGGHDNEMKTVREKEKCPDVLAMVLSMKKRALMQDPEVQKFLKDVMEVIKS